MQGDGSYDWRWNNIRMMYKRLGSSSIDRTESEEITVTIKDGIADLSKELGLEAGKAMEITLQFSDSITTAADGTIITDELSSFITINGVSLDRRMEGDRKLKMDTIPDEIYDGYNVVITSENGGKTIKVLLLGGGEGNLVADAANTILISEDLPIKNGNVLGKGANFYYNPATDKWEATEASNNDETKSPDTSDSTMPFAIAVASVIASATVIFTGKKKIAKNSKA